MPLVHKNKPTRSVPEQKGRYGAYKPELRDDFNRSCGYCDDDDFYALNGRAFHIDHFAPRSKFSHLETEYSNLVYSCPICNVYKGNYWASDSENEPVVGEEGVVDPCSVDYDTHLVRDEGGRIIPITPLGEFIHSKLKLGLRRHQLIWLISKSDELISRLEEELKNHEEGSDKHAELEAMTLSVLREFRQYTNALREQ